MKQFLNKGKLLIVAVWIMLAITIVGCSTTDLEGLESTKNALENSATMSDNESFDEEKEEESSNTDSNNVSTQKEETKEKDSSKKEASNDKVDSKKSKSNDKFTVPKYNGKAYATINNNKPTFKDSELKKSSYETYSKLDSLGRCGIARANIGKDIMPKEDRGSIGSVKPSGWHTVKYDVVDGKYLYNRCHLIGFQLTGENANVKNLITGTRYMNVDGMLPFENMVADYVKETGRHVLYQVEPIFEGDNLVATGVHMQAKSVEDKGKGISFNIFVFNVQPGVKIDYATGNSSLDGTSSNKSTSNKSTSNNKTTTSKNATSSKTYVLNMSTKKFHYDSCSSAKIIADKNKNTFKGNRQELINKGYDACKRCNP